MAGRPTDQLATIWTSRTGDCRIILGDCLESLRTLESGSVNCCITSPPYWGLRDYGHDGQIGLEKTPDEYVAKMVDVFREVRRVLRGDGTLWLNLGITYAGSGMTGGNSGFNASGGADGFKQKRQFKRVADGKRATRSPLLRRDLACDIDGKEPLCSPGGDRACLGFYDERSVETPSRHVDSDGTCQPDEQCELPPLPTDRDTERSDCEPEPRGALLRGDQVSTMPKSSLQHPGECGPLDAASAYQLSPSTSPSCAAQSEHTTVCTSDTSQTLPPLAIRTQGRESFFSACHRSDCRGIGRCGLCWCSLTIPSLGIKAKDEVNIPHLVAMALQADGWTLRQTIVWSKPNPMPESVTDRCTKAHEYIFLLAKSERYYYDHEAVKEAAVYPGDCRHERADLRKELEPRCADGGSRARTGNPTGTTRNRRSVWTVSTKPYSGAHFATYPPDLIEPCVKAGCPEGGTILDPFNGSGTTGAVAFQFGRKYIGLEINPEYVELAKKRISEAEESYGMPLFAMESK